MRIHPTAVLHPSLDLPPDLEAGPYSMVDEDVVMAPGIRIGPFSHVYPGVRLDAGVRLEDGVIVGNVPQDKKYRGEKTGVRIGAGTHLREYVTVNRGTAASGWTTIGSKCLIMAYSHVAHDCFIEDGAIIANGVQMGGHVHIGRAAVISGMTGIHQYVVIGAGAFIGGGLRVDKDVLPFSKGLGDPLRYAGINEIGLARFGLVPGAGPALKSFYRELFREGKDAAMSRLTLLPSEKDGGVGDETERQDFGELDALLKAFFMEQKRSLLMRPLVVD
ncbi:MAG: acyl-ACP--UDP-N-acetylglucosamine O-acyltransferase [Fibrobacterota bacterium]|nr:acyl-ACP--UDP-N-acetylglucosamine O-acyltransferase [Fibrobacterota bacterium]